MHARAKSFSGFSQSVIFSVWRARLTVAVGCASVMAASSLALSVGLGPRPPRACVQRARMVAILALTT
jgi:hypothetical protein